MAGGHQGPTGGSRAAGGKERGREVAKVRVTARLLHATSSRHFFIIIALRWNLFRQGSVIEWPTRLFDFSGVVFEYDF